MDRVIAEVRAERARQERRWGEQNHPDVCPVLTGREGGATPQRIAEDLEIPTETRAKYLCGLAARAGRLTWAVILVEEVAEAVAAAARGDRAGLRAELIQVAAVAVAWAEAIDRREVSRG